MNIQRISAFIERSLWSVSQLLWPFSVCISILSSRSLQSISQLLCFLPRLCLCIAVTFILKCQPATLLSPASVSLYCSHVHFEVLTSAFSCVCISTLQSLLHGQRGWSHWPINNEFADSCVTHDIATKCCIVTHHVRWLHTPSTNLVIYYVIVNNKRCSEQIKSPRSHWRVGFSCSHFNRYGTN